MSERFYAPELNEAAGQLLLEGPEFHHLRTVCRAKVGTVVELFNGAGGWASAQVLEISRRDAVLLLSDYRQEPAPAAGLTLACCLPKGDRAGWLIEKCTELGVATFVPLHSERSVVEPREHKLDKLRRAVVEACKQCGRNRLMEIAEPRAWSEYLDAAPSPRWLLDLDGVPLALRSSEESAPACVAIGPEGGWSPSERDGAESAGWKFVRLPYHTLRIETAALAAACLAAALQSTD